MDKKERHKLKMKLKRQRQLSRVPDIDSRILNFSKNSLPEYRKAYVRDLSKKSE